MEQEGDLRWWPRVKNAWPYATWIVTLLFVVGALLGWFAAWRMGVGSILGFILATSDPAAAALVLLLFALAVPDLYAPNRLVPLHIVTVPTLYAAGIFLFRMIISASPIGSVLTLSNIPRLDRIWSNMIFLAALWIMQVVVLHVAWLIQRRTPSAKDKIS